jgi:hypothetical protein
MTERDFLPPRKPHEMPTNKDRFTPGGNRLPDPDTDRHWHTGLQRWVWPSEVTDALNQAQLVIDEYYNGDRAWAEAWLLKAHEANKNDQE